MTTLRELKTKAKEFDGKVVVNDYNPHDQSTQIDIEAPDGKQWAGAGVQILLGFFWSYDKQSRYDAYTDLIGRMNYGLEPLDHD